MRRDFETLVETPFYRIRYVKGCGNTLVISFASIGNRREEMPPDEFVGTITSDTSRHGVFVSDIRRSWMNDKEYRDAISGTLPDLIKRLGAHKVTAIGLSIGAFSALVAHRLFQVDAVLAFSPQYSVDDSIVPEETRWRHWTNQIEEFIYPTVEPLQSRGKLYVLHGLESDLSQMVRFPYQKNLNHYVFPELRHSTVAKAIKDADKLVPLLAAVERGKSEVVKHIIQQVGGTVRSGKAAFRLARSRNQAKQWRPIHQRPFVAKR